MPLRERKAARIRHTLITSSMARMTRDGFAAVRVTDLCRDAEITEQTFFNYFPTKGLLLSYIILLWGIETEYYVRRRERESSRSAVASIEDAFAFTARKLEEAPRVAAELLGRQATRQGPPLFPDISTADRLLRYPDLDGIETIPAVGILGILRPRIARALEAGEIPSSVEPETILMGLYSIFVGVPLFLLRERPEAVGDAFREQLAVLWRGIGHVTGAAVDRFAPTAKGARKTK